MAGRLPVGRAIATLLLGMIGSITGPFQYSGTSWAQNRDSTEEIAAFEKATVIQLRRCRNVLQRADIKVIVKFHVSLHPDGSIRSAVDENPRQYALDSYYRAASDSARRAIYSCSPVQIPAGKFDTLKELTLTFSSGEPELFDDRRYGSNLEANIWGKIADSRDPADLRGFLARFPTSPHKAEILQRMKEMGEDVSAYSP